MLAKGPFALDDNDVFFLSSYVNSYIGDNATISDDMLTTSKICVAVTKCEGALVLNHDTNLIRS